MNKSHYIMLGFIIGSAIQGLFAIFTLPKPPEPVNLVALVNKYEDKIASQSAEIERQAAEIKEWKNSSAEDAQIQFLYDSYLTSKQSKELWDEWAKNICPKYHAAEASWYCK